MMFGEHTAPAVASRIVGSALKAGVNFIDTADSYVDVYFSAADEALVDRPVPRGHPSTPGYTDPKYPVAGRVPLTG